MQDMPDFAKQLLENADPKARQKIESMMGQMQSASGGQAAPTISADQAAVIEKAAQAAQRGDKAGAVSAIGEILSTPEGKNLAEQLKFLMGK